MKETVVNQIVLMLKSQGIDTDGMADKLYYILKDVDISAKETQLALRDDALNEQLLSRFIAAKMVKGCTENTILQYRRELIKILRKLGKPVTDIRSDDIRLYIAVRLTQDRISKTTANNELRYLRTFFTWLTAEEIITNDPMLKIESIKLSKTPKKAFTEIECEKLRSSCRTTMETAIVEVLLSTGCRVSELCKMKIEEIEDGKITVHGKGNKDRTVYLNAKAQLALDKFLAERRDSNPYIFPSGIYMTMVVNGKQKTPNHNPFWFKDPKLIGDGMREKGGIEAAVRRIGKRAGVENTHPHRFRRTSATFALRRGMPIEMVSKMLGHEQLTTTQIYLDLTEDDLEAAHRKFVT